MLRRIVRRVLFGKKRNYRKRKYDIYATWHAHNALQAQIDNLIKHLKLKRIAGTNLVGDKKDADKFDNQFNY